MDTNPILYLIWHQTLIVNETSAQNSTIFHLNNLKALFSSSNPKTFYKIILLSGKPNSLINCSPKYYLAIIKLMFTLILFNLPLILSSCSTDLDSAISQPVETLSYFLISGKGYNDLGKFSECTGDSSRLWLDCVFLIVVVKMTWKNYFRI